MGSRREEINLDDCLRGLEEGGRLVERAKGVIGDIERIRGGVFSRLNGGEVGEEGRLECMSVTALSLFLGEVARADR